MERSSRTAGNLGAAGNRTKEEKEAAGKVVLHNNLPERSPPRDHLPEQLAEVVHLHSFTLFADNSVE